MGEGAPSFKPERRAPKIGGNLLTNGAFRAGREIAKGERIMLGWAIAFLVIALVAAALGFGGAAGTAIAAAQLIFVMAIVAFLASALLGLARRPH
jgi:uncharacterized membrane protein YtjA (UPF0391 family)